MFFIKKQNQFGFVKELMLRWHLRRELERLKLNQGKLQRAVSQAEQMKSAITDWTREH